MACGHTEIQCPRCGIRVMKSDKLIKRARENSRPIWCGRTCANKARKHDGPRTEDGKYILVTAECSWCGKEFERRNGDLLRSIKAGSDLFCGNSCSGISRRLNHSPEYKRDRSRKYYRALMGNPERKAKWLASRRAYYHKNRERIREYFRLYDSTRRYELEAENFGEFAEAYLALMKLKTKIKDMD